MDRLEYKYLVPADSLEALRRAFAPFVENDSHIRPERGEYTVRSIYLDTCSLDYYYQKESGIQHRRKLRIRGYDERETDEQVFLEIKRKDDMAVSKARALVPYGAVGDLLISGAVERYIDAAERRDRRDAQSFLYHFNRYSLRPTALVTYDREAFLCKYDGSLRITFDKNLRSLPFPGLEDLFAERGVRRSLRGYFVLEIKFFKGIPAWLKSILERFRLERQAVSKYAISLETHGIPQRSSARSVFAATRPFNRAARREATVPHSRQSHLLAAG